MQKLRKIVGITLAVCGSYTIVKAQELRVGSLHNRQNEVVKETPKTEDTVKAKPAAIPQAMPFKPSASATKASDEKKDADTKEKEVLLASSEKIPAGAVASKPEPKKQIPHSNKPLLTEYKHNGKFDPVPLAGELNYYKHNNDAMLAYTKRYMSSFNRRLSSLSSDRKIQTLKTIDGIFDKHDIPREMKYLAVIESALNAHATSPVGAKGYWQFMAPTGRMMGLKIVGGRDDRTHLTKSTYAAAKYLAYLYDEFDDWLLVVASYNCGPRPVINAIKRTGKNDFWSIKKYLPKETQNHVMAFVATATIMERMPHLIESGLPNDFDWKSLNINRKAVAAAEDKRKKEHPLLSRFSEEEVSTIAMIRVNKPLDLEVVARLLDTDRRQLGRWNYDYFTYLSEFEAGKSTYNLRIPKDKVEKYLEMKSQIERDLMELN